MRSTPWIDFRVRDTHFFSTQWTANHVVYNFMEIQFLAHGPELRSEFSNCGITLLKRGVM